MYEFAFDMNMSYVSLSHQSNVQIAKVFSQQKALPRLIFNIFPVKPLRQKVYLPLGMRTAEEMRIKINAKNVGRMSVRLNS